MKLGMLLGLALCTSHMAEASDLEIRESVIGDWIVEVPITGLSSDEIALEIDRDQLLAPWKIRPWTTNGPPVHLAVLIQDSEFWIGNDAIDMIPADDPSRYPGVLPELGRALDAVRMPELPPHSQQWMATYGSRFHWLDTDRIIGTVLGHQARYFGRTGTALSDAVEAAAKRMIEHAPQRRHIVVAIGDGCDDADRERRLAVRRFLARYNVELHVLVYKGKTSCDGSPAGQLTAQLRHVVTIEQIQQSLHGIVRGLDDRMYAWFDREELPRDGTLHEYRVRAGGQHFGPVYREVPPPPSGPSRTVWIAVAVALALGASWVGRRWLRGAILR